MTDDFLFIPFPRKLYDDIIRFSDGRIDPVAVAQEQLLDLMRCGADSFLVDWFGDRLEEFLSIHFPDILEDWEKKDAERVAAKLAKVSPLVWKDVTVPAGSEVRMQYDGTYHYGKVKEGRIADEDGTFTPSEWASKVAAGTSRNAWRDLWFKFPGVSVWVSAMNLREQAKQIIGEVGL